MGLPQEVVKESLRPTASTIQHAAPWFLGIGGLPEITVLGGMWGWEMVALHIRGIRQMTSRVEMTFIIM